MNFNKLGNLHLLIIVNWFWLKIILQFENKKIFFPKL